MAMRLPSRRPMRRYQGSSARVLLGVAPCVVDHRFAAHFAEHLGAGVDAFGAVGALKLVRGFANVDAHGTGAHAFLAKDALAGVFLKVDQQGVLVGQHVLQVAVRADGGAEARAQEGEIEDGDQGDAGAGDAGGGAHVKREQAMEEVDGRNKIGDEDKGDEDGGGQKNGGKQRDGNGAPQAGAQIRELTIDHAIDAFFEAVGGFAEDHLRAEIAAPEAAVDHGHGRHRDPDKHHGEEEDGELVDVELRAEEVEALAGQVDAHDVKERKRAKDDDTEELDVATNAMKLRARQDVADAAISGGGFCFGAIHEKAFPSTSCCACGACGRPGHCLLARRVR